MGCDGSKSIATVARARRGVDESRTALGLALCYDQPMHFLTTLTLALMATLVSGCAVVAVVDTAVSVTATLVETTVDVAAGVVDAVIPDAD